jgi:uncharacterized protein YqjF (DUF2071 family)
MTWLQRWTDVLFLHFAVAADELEPQLPPQLELDTFDDHAWLSFIFFRLKLRPVGLPFIPGFSSLLEMNVRTYVRHCDRPGIYFLKMYADNRLAIQAARWLTPLYYEHATMVDRRLVDDRRHVECSPTTNCGCGLSLDYQIAGDPAEAALGSLDSWLVERYRLFVARSKGSILAGDVEHPPWRISPVKLSVVKNHIADSIRLRLGETPTAASFSSGVVAQFNSFRVVSRLSISRSEYSVPSTQY